MSAAAAWATEGRSSAGAMSPAVATAEDCRNERLETRVFMAHVTTTVAGRARVRVRQIGQQSNIQVQGTETFIMAASRSPPSSESS